jgi:methyl-accepting chemotaxis protein
MAWFPFLHRHEVHRSRQLRWVVPAALLVLLAILVGSAIVYQVGDRAVDQEFFRAHKTVSHTGELLSQAVWVGAGCAVAVLGAAALYALWLTHRIVRPVHTLHRAMDALADGDLGVRVELHHRDEFQEIGESMNRLAERIHDTVGTAVELARQLDEIAAAPGANDVADADALKRLAEELRGALQAFRLTPRRALRAEDL